MTGDPVYKGAIVFIILCVTLLGCLVPLAFVGFPWLAYGTLALICGVGFAASLYVILGKEP